MSALSSEIPASASALKDQGNAALAASHFAEAADLYTQAIEIHEHPVFFSNRGEQEHLVYDIMSLVLTHSPPPPFAVSAMAYIRMEQYGLAIVDADSSIKMDPEYVKAYYRRGSAQFALGKNKQAKKDFKKVCQMKPKDKVRATDEASQGYTSKDGGGGRWWRWGWRWYSRCCYIGVDWFLPARART